MAEPLTDEVVDAAREGSAQAVETIWKALSRPVYGYLSARGVDDPEGLTSEVFVALLPRLATVTGGAAGVRTLVFSIAHARMVDSVRHRRRHPPPAVYDPAADARIVAAAEEEAMRGSGTSHVLGLLSSLPESQRDVLVLRIVADLSIEQVAAILGRSEGAVKQLQRRALLALRELLPDRDVTR